LILSLLYKQSHKQSHPCFKITVLTIVLSHPLEINNHSSITIHRKVFSDLPIAWWPTPPTIWNSRNSRRLSRWARKSCKWLRSFWESINSENELFSFFCDTDHFLAIIEIPYESCRWFIEKYNRQNLEILCQLTPNRQIAQDLCSRCDDSCQ
jgi:hypothetical protein